MFVHYASDLRIVLGPRLAAVKDWIANWHSSSGMADSKQAVEGRLLMPADPAEDSNTAEASNPSEAEQPPSLESLSL